MSSTASVRSLSRLKSSLLAALLYKSKISSSKGALTPDWRGTTEAGLSTKFAKGEVHREVLHGRASDLFSIPLHNSSCVSNEIISEAE